MFFRFNLELTGYCLLLVEAFHFAAYDALNTILRMSVVELAHTCLLNKRGRLSTAGIPVSSYRQCMLLNFTSSS
jgi:hypothetical protein